MNSFILFSEGSFGDAVAERIAAIVSGVQIMPLIASVDSLESLLHGKDFVGVASWRRYPDELDRLDEACNHARIPWSSVILEGPRIQCGPIIIPGQGPCYACYRNRWLTHLPFPEREQALEAAYASDYKLGLRGFTPSSARIAAAALLLDKKELARGPGRLRLIDLLYGSVEESRVIRIHGCARCSRETEPGKRYVRELVNALRIV